MEPETLKNTITPTIDESIETEASYRSVLKRVFLKLDLRIIPCLWFLYFLSSLGGAAYGNAITMNMSTNHSIPLYLNISSHDLSTANAMDYVAYIIFDLPMNLIMTVVDANTWLSRSMIMIGVVYACYGAVANAPGLIALRFFTGLATAGIWPGMAYYISMWYPAEMTARRIGYYFTAAQISAAVAGLIAAGFQKMNLMRGYTGYQWLFIIYGCITILYGLVVIFVLPDRPEILRRPIKHRFLRVLSKLSPKPPSPIKPGAETEAHEIVMKERFEAPLQWDMKTLGRVIIDPRLYTLVVMYFGVVGCGIGLMVFGTTIINVINPEFTSIQLSLLTAPIWLFDLAACLLIPPISDRIDKHRGLVFSLSTALIMAGLFVTTYASRPWSRYGGLLICGFGLGPTVPINMTWAATIFSKRHGDVGAAASTALVSGLGNLGSVFTTYALYRGWPSDKERGYKYSNMVMVAILGLSILGALATTLLQFWLGDFGNQSLVDVTFLRWFRRRRV